MTNLLNPAVAESHILAILRQAPTVPMLPPLGSAPWERLRTDPVIALWMADVKSLAEEEAERPLPELTDALYASFFKTGERWPFENVYFERRRRLARAAMVVLLGDADTRQRQAASLIRKIGEIMDEESWTFPAHVWEEPSGKDPMMIDLFAAETANLMGELLTLFPTLIPAGLSARIRERLRGQYFDNYLRRHAQFVWTSLPMNWNAVCHQGVLGAAMAVDDDLERVARMLWLAGQSLRIFLGGFGNDGSTSEGPGYWSYGFGRFAELNAQLETRTDGRLSVFGDNPLITRIAMFAPGMSLANDYLVNFSDGNRRGTLGPELLTYLGQRLQLPSLSELGQANYRKQAAQKFDVHGQRVDLFTYARQFLRCPDLTTEIREPGRPDVYFPDYGAIVAHGRDTAKNLWEFAAKAGNNAEHHNHNDCGSFLLNVNGEPAIIEIGAPEYVHGYFGDESRYTYLAARSLGHAVPFVNGCEQAAGAQFAAQVLSYENQLDRVEFVVDLTACYPAAARCRRLVRKFVLARAAGTLEIEDRFELEEPGSFETILICEAAVRSEGDAVFIDAPGATLRVSPAGGLRFGVECCPYRTRDAKDAHVNRLRFSVPEPVASGVAAFRISLEPAAAVTASVA
jgi:hypothetical protein